MRALRSAREGAETERKRHLAWEREQEAKYTQRQADMERQMHELRQEISLLKAYISLHPSMDINMLSDVLPLSARITPVPLPPEESETISSPATTASQPSVAVQTPQYIQGSSSQPLNPDRVETTSQPPSTSSGSQLIFMEEWNPEAQRSHRSRAPPTRDSSSPSLSQQDTSLRRSEEFDYSSGDDDDESSTSAHTDEHMSRKRLNGHDARCLTIQVCDFRD